MNSSNNVTEDNINTVYFLPFVKVLHERSIYHRKAHLKCTRNIQNSNESSQWNGLFSVTCFKHVLITDNENAQNVIMKTVF